MVSPVGGRSHKEPDGGGVEPVRLTAIRLLTSTPWQLGARCVPAGHRAVAEYEDEDAPERVEIHFDRAVCCHRRCKNDPVAPEWN